MQTLADTPPARAADTAPAGTATCPPWCEIDDHDAYDGGEMLHTWSDSVELSAFPFKAGGETCHEIVAVIRQQAGDGDPVIMLQVPVHVPSFTFGEAAGLISALQRALSAEQYPNPRVPATQAAAEPDARLG